MLYLRMLHSLNHPLDFLCYTVWPKSNVTLITLFQQNIELGCICIYLLLWQAENQAGRVCVLSGFLSSRLTDQNELRVWRVCSHWVFVVALVLGALSLSVQQHNCCDVVKREKGKRAQSLLRLESNWISLTVKLTPRFSLGSLREIWFAQCLLLKSSFLFL